MENLFVEREVIGIKDTKTGKVNIYNRYYTAVENRYTGEVVKIRFKLDPKAKATLNFIYGDPVGDPVEVYEIDPDNGVSD